MNVQFRSRSARQRAFDAVAVVVTSLFAQGCLKDLTCEDRLTCPRDHNDAASSGTAPEEAGAATSASDSSPEASESSIASGSATVTREAGPNPAGSADGAPVATSSGAPEVYDSSTLDSGLTEPGAEDSALDSSDIGGEDAAIESACGDGILQAEAPSNEQCDDGNAYSGDGCSRICIRESVALAAYHSCALTPTGSVKCWGEGSYGQLGHGGDADFFEPGPEVDVSGEVTAVTAGDYHSCALTADGQVYCWGGNFFGQLGIASAADSVNSPTDPVNFDTDSVKALDAGAFHTCALSTDGSVKCWGRNDHGELGLGVASDPTDSPTATVDLGQAAVAQLSAGGAHTCALLTDGNVKCWGDNQYGQLGLGFSGVPVPGPSEDVDFGGDKVAALATGQNHTCALLENGRVKCWGSNGSGPLGTGDSVSTAEPTTSVNLGSGALAVAVSAGEKHTCALLERGAVKCWGNNDYGQLGLENFADVSVPTATEDVKLGTAVSVQELASGGGHNCAVLGVGEIKCWGKGDLGELGLGTTDNRGDGRDAAGDPSPDMGDALPLVILE